MGADKRLDEAPFGKTRDGTEVRIYTLRNARGMEARITNYGGTITSLTAPDRKGRFEDVVLGFDSLDGYLDEHNPYFGALIGRYANRIAGGRFKLNRESYTLAVNNGVNTLHGGKKGFDKVVWKVTGAAYSATGPRLSLEYTSKDGEEGYPGDLTARAVYTLEDDNTLRLELTATTNKDTVVNLTQHSYFNLRGHGDVLQHSIQIYADRFTPIDSGLIPTGKLKPVAGTPFDFLKRTAIGARIDGADEQLQFGKGYDHNWVVNRSSSGLERMATVVDPESGRTLEISSTAPGLQFYTGNFLDGSVTGKRNVTYGYRSGFCVEPQSFPDSPNKPGFPSTVLEPGQTYRNVIVYRFSVSE